MTDTTTAVTRCDCCFIAIALPSAQPHKTLKFCASCLDDYYGSCSFCGATETVRGFRFGRRQDQCWQRACPDCVVKKGLKKKIDATFMTTEEALKILSDVLVQESIEEEGLSIFDHLGPEASRMQRPLNSDGFNWIACYAVTGGNEGHYVHIDMIHKKEEREIIASIKTFNGMTKAYEVALRCAELLGA